MRGLLLGLLAAALPRLARADTLYIAGGDGGEGQALDMVEQFSVEGDGPWTTIQPLPQPRIFTAAAAVDKSLYVVDGKGSYKGAPTGSTYRYDQAGGEWSSMASTPPNYWGAVTADDDADVVYSVGGEGRGSSLMFDARAGRWAELPDLNHERSGCMAAVVDSILWVFGGYDGNNAFRDQGEWLEITEDEWACRQNPSSCGEDGLATGTKTGHRRLQADGCTDDDLGAGLASLGRSCGSQVPSSCTTECGSAFIPFWRQCGGALRQSEHADMMGVLSPLIAVCIGGGRAAGGSSSGGTTGTGSEAIDNGFDTHAWEQTEEHGSAPVEVAADCSHFSGDALLECTRDTQNGDPMKDRKHVCGDDCSGQWHVLDEAMSARRAYGCAAVLDHDQDGDQEIFVVGGEHRPFLFCSCWCGVESRGMTERVVCRQIGRRLRGRIVLPEVGGHVRRGEAQVHNSGGDDGASL